MQKVAIGLIIVAILSAASSKDVYDSPLNTQAEETLLIQSGESLSRLGDRLESSGWLPWPQLLFKLYSRLTSNQGHIQAGEYVIDQGMTVPQLLRTLRNGEVVQRSVTFPEGWTVEQWLRLLAETEYVSGASRAEIILQLGALSELEGQLFPDTYSYTRGERAVSILSRARRKMTQVLDEVWQSRSRHSAVPSAKQALILASMIEKETGYEGDRRLIASVFSNRLNRGMKLQSDPTVIYGLENFDGDLKRRHLAVKHEFNTYVIDDLPIGPICNPGRSSIEAAVNPEASGYYYFVAKGDGHSQFSETLEQHNRAVVQFQKNGRVKNYRSTPPKGDKK